MSQIFLKYVFIWNILEMFIYRNRLTNSRQEGSLGGPLIHPVSYSRIDHTYATSHRCSSSFLLEICFLGHILQYFIILTIKNLH